MHVVLEMLEGPSPGRRFRVPEDAPLRVGRSRQADLMLPDLTMSGVHFAVELLGDRCRVRDLGSTNGTYLNEERIKEAELAHGAKIRAGHVTFLVRFEGRTQSPSGEPSPIRTPADPGPRTGTEDATLPTIPVGVRSAPGATSRSGLQPRRDPVPAAAPRRQPAPTPAREPAAPAPAPAPGIVQKIALPGQAPDGEPILGILLKRTYDIVSAGRCARAAADRKLIPGDVPYDDPMNSSIEFETDFIPFKLATDVVLNGKAFAPRGVATRELTVSLQVGRYRKDIRVIGDRECRHREHGEPEFTDPRPFTTMDLRYERAYGGIDLDSDPRLPCPYPRNPLGCGFVVGRSARAIDRLALPNLEDPHDLLTPDRLVAGRCLNWEKQPFPQGFGWFPMCWQPRASLAGVMPAERQIHEDLRKAYAPLVPPDQKEVWEQTRLRDMDFGFFNGASPGLVVPYLNGDEEVRLANLSPERELTFQLPGDCPGMAVDIGFGLQEPSVVVLHTLMIRMEDRQLDLVWRGAIPYPGPDWLPNMSKMEILFQ